MAEQSESFHSMKIWLLAIRPKTLTAAVVPIIASTALMRAMGGPIQWWIAFFALASSLCIQMATNLINDYLDHKKGADTETRLGPTRVTQAGLVSERQTQIAALICVVAAVLLGIPLVMQGGWVIVGIGVLSLAMAYAYTGGPFPLAYKGLGDLFVILFFGLIAVGGMSYLQTGSYSIEAVILGLQIGMHCAVLIAVNNLRDMESDKLAAKKTLPVRFGKSFARAEIAVLCLAPFLLQSYWFAKGWMMAFGLGFLPLPLAIHLIVSIYKHEPGRIYNKFLAGASALHFLFGSLLSLGMIL